MCEVHVDGIRLDDESGTDGAECSRKVAGAVKSLINANDLQLECASLA